MIARQKIHALRYGIVMAPTNFLAVVDDQRPRPGG